MNLKVLLGLGAFFLAGGFAGYGVGRWTAGTGESSGTTSAVAEGPAVATYNGGSITARTLRERMAEEGPLLRQRYTTTEGKQELLQRMVREQVLAGEARQKGYDRNPQVVRQCEGALVGAYLEQELEAPERNRSVADAELRTFFEQHRSEYSQPARARVAHLFLEAAEGDAAKRSRQRGEAQALLKQLRSAVKRDRDAFTTLARSRSEDVATRPYGGELPAMTETEMREVLGSELTSAVLAASTTEGLLEQIFETPRGFHIVWLVERQSAVSPDFESLRETVSTRFIQSRRSTRHSEFMASVEQRAQLQVNQAALEAVEPPALSQATTPPR
jgi:parvulin-like peptidyl-prolyl isomerase